MLTHVISQHLVFQFVVFVFSTPIKVLDKGIQPLVLNSIAIQLYVDIENDDKNNLILIHTRVEKCCFTNDENVTCDYVHLQGEFLDWVRPKERKSYLFIYPTMYQLNLFGYCDIDVGGYCDDKKLYNSKQIKIIFDTRLKKKRKQVVLKNYRNQKTSHCKTADLDPLNKCAPVACDQKYSGAMPFFDKNKNKCVAAPSCNRDLNKRLPTTIYDPTSNKCKDLDHPLPIDSIYALNSGLNVVIKSKKRYRDTEPVILQADCSSLSQHILFIKDLVWGTLNEDGLVDFTKSCQYAITPILLNIIGISVILLLLVCCLNTTMWCCKAWNDDSLSRTVNDIKHNIKSKDLQDFTIVGTNNMETAKLLKDVIVADLPIHVNGSVMDESDRARELRCHRSKHVSRVRSSNLKAEDDTTDTNTTSDLNNSEKEKLLQ